MQILSRFGAKENQDQEESRKKKLLDEYYAAQAQLRRSRAAFESVTDPDLISACIYEVNAAQSRCSFLLTRLREEQISGQSLMW